MCVDREAEATARSFVRGLRLKHAVVAFAEGEGDLPRFPVKLGCMGFVVLDAHLRFVTTRTQPSLSSAGYAGLEVTEATLRRAAAQAVSMAGLPEGEAEALLEDLERVAPGLAPRFGRMKVADLARLATRVDDVAKRMVELRLLFPTADLNRLVTSRPGILLEPLADLELLPPKLIERLAAAAAGQLWICSRDRGDGVRPASGSAGGRERGGRAALYNARACSKCPEMALLGAPEPATALLSGPRD